MNRALGRLSEMPRHPLAHLPTPVELMANLSSEIGKAKIYVKRDDCTGLALGGNKIRQLEYYVGAAEAKGADTLLITGAVQSNYVRSTVAAAAKRGMACHVQLEERVPDPTDLYRTSGNVLLDELMGATVHYYPDGEDEAGADRRLGEIAAELRQQGRSPYIVPLSPGHPPLAALGYIDAAKELLEQIEAMDVRVDRIFVASGSGNTHAGLLYGLRAYGSSIPVTGVCVRRSEDLQVPRLATRCDEIASLLEADNPVAAGDIVVDDHVLAPGYGRMNDAVSEAINLAARKEAILVDPVYTGRVLASLIAHARKLSTAENLLFIHTGGTPAIFAYEQELRAGMS